MCGILGYFSPKFDVIHFQQALKSLNHRGPYGQGFTCLANGALGMVRLPMSGNSPMAVPPQVLNYTVAFNGEVYTPGHQLKDEVETLILALRKSSVPDGMFAIAYWDEVNRELVLYRDQFGIKPLYYIYQPEHSLLAFSSELKPLLELLNKPRINKKVVAEIVSTGVSLEFSTLIEGVNLLAPGTKMTFSLTDQGFHLRRTEVIKSESRKDFREIEELIGKSLDVCKDTFRKTALLISGGVDSNILNTYLDLGYERFNLQIEGHNDSPPNNTLVKKIKFSEHDFLETLRKAVKNYASASRMTSLLMYQKLSDGLGDAGYHSVIVGEGADEMFWGYSRHLELWENHNNLNTNKFATYWFGDYFSNSHYLSDNLRQSTCETIDKLTRDALSQGFESAIEIFDLNYSLEPLLRRSDHLLMSRTIEARTPFLHCGLAYSLPRNSRVQNGLGKAELYKILRKRSPTWVPRAKKHFRAPLSDWNNAKTAMRKEVSDSLDFLQQVGLEKLTPNTISVIPDEQLFTLTTLSIWKQEFGKYL